MTLEVLNTLGTLATVLIVAATAIAALIQLRHLRAGNQIHAMLAIDEYQQSREYRDASYLVGRRLPQALADPLFREYHAAMALGRELPNVSDEYVVLRRAAMKVGESWEHLGNLSKHGVVDLDMLLDTYGYQLRIAWARLADNTAFLRAVTGEPSIFENFEWLTVMADDWYRRYGGSAYPKGVRRLEVRNPWPVPLMSHRT